MHGYAIIPQDCDQGKAEFKLRLERVQTGMSLRISASDLAWLELVRRSFLEREEWVLQGLDEHLRRNPSGK